MLYTSSDFAPDLPLNNPRIGWQNLLREAEVSATGQSGQNAPDATQNALTWDFWIPNALPANITYTLEEAADFDYIGIASHTIGTDGATVTFSYHDGSDWVDIKTVSPSDNSPIILLFNEIETDQIRISLTGTANPAVGVVYAGKILVSQRRIYQGHTPITLGKRTTIRPQRSEGGQWLGRSIVREGAETSISLSNLTADWVREYFKPFMDSAIKYPFFFAWRGEKFPEEVAYCWTDQDIVPSNSGPRDFMSVSFAVDAQID